MAALFNNRKIWNMLRDVVPHPYQEKDARQFIDMCGRSRRQNNFAVLAGGEVVGGIGLIPQVDVHRLSAEVGYWVGEPYWGKGICVEALAHICQLAFVDREFHRLYALVFANNPASMRVLEKAGFRKEGVFLEASIKNGYFLDEHRFGLLKTEFLN